MTREEAAKILQDSVDEVFNAGVEIISRDGEIAVELAIEALMERKTGAWIHQYKEIPNMSTFKCSCCGCVDEFAAKYCSNCGAKMEVEK